MKPPNTVIVCVPSYMEPGYVHPSPGNLAAQQLLRDHLQRPLAVACDTLEAADCLYSLTSLVRDLDTIAESWCAETVRMIHYLTKPKRLKMALEYLDAWEAEGANPCIMQRARVTISGLETIHALADEFVKAYPKPKRKYTRRAPDTQLQFNI